MPTTRRSKSVIKILINKWASLNRGKNVYTRLILEFYTLSNIFARRTFAFVIKRKS